MIGLGSAWLWRFPLISILVAGATAGAGAAKLYKWVDDNGQVHYSESIPLQYRDRANVEIDRRGRVLRRNEAQAEKKRQFEEESGRKQAEERRLTEAARRDKALLDTYTNESEIDLARDRNIAFPQQVLESFDPRINTARQRVETLRVEKQALVKAGKPVPPALVSEISANDKALEALLEQQKAKQAEIEQIREKYAAQKARYRELMDSAASAGGAAKTP